MVILKFDAFECIFLFNNELSPLFVNIDLCASTKICLLEYACLNVSRIQSSRDFQAETHKI